MVKKHRLLLIVSIIGLITVLSTGTYAYLRKTLTQSGQNDIGTLSCLDIDLTNITNGINLTGEYPVSDAEGKTKTPYTFRITNNCSSDVSATINLESLSGNTLLNTYLKASINEVGSVPIVVELGSLNEVDATITGATSNTLLDFDIDGNATIDYELRLWIKESITKEQGANKSYTGKIVIAGSPKLKINWNNAPQGTLLYSIKNDPLNTITTPFTSIGSFAYKGKQAQTLVKNSAGSEYVTMSMYGDRFEVRNYKELYYGDSCYDQREVMYYSDPSMSGLGAWSSSIDNLVGHYFYIDYYGAGTNCFYVESYSNGILYGFYPEDHNYDYISIPASSLARYVEPGEYVYASDTPLGIACYQNHDSVCASNYEQPVQYSLINDADQLIGKYIALMECEDTSIYGYWKTCDYKSIRVTPNIGDMMEPVHSFSSVVRIISITVDSNDPSLFHVMVERNSDYITYADTYDDLYNQYNTYGDNYEEIYDELEGKYVYYDPYAGYATYDENYLVINNLGPVIAYVVSATSSSITLVMDVRSEIISNYEDDEAIMASTTDDFGTSYYFRGAVDNNFVVFANMCWQIVRVDGNGSIKLVLYNSNDEGLTQNICSNHSLAINNMDLNSHIRNANAAIGYMYGIPRSSSYSEEHANRNKSLLMKALEYWYENKLINYSNQLADTVWCNDKSISSGSGYGSTNTYYSGWNRIYGSSSPSLVCAGGNNNSLSKFSATSSIGNGKLKYKIGILSADEVSFAGVGKSSDYPGDIISYLLYDNNSMLTLTPEKFLNNYPYMVVVYDNGFYEGYGNSGLIKPAIALKSNVTISSGNGTQNNPYVID